MNKKTMIIKAAEYAVIEMIEKRSTSCLVAEAIDSNINHVKLHEITWPDVLIGLRELESEEE